MKVLVFGAGGMLGHKLVQVFSRDLETFGTIRGRVLDFADLPVFDRTKLIGGVDATDREIVEEVLCGIRPDVVVNAVGLVKQHAAGSDEHQCREINELLPRRLASAADAVGARFIGISTDCVFSGREGNYNESSVPDAEDIYGKSKLSGEVTNGTALTVRTSIIGRELSGAQGLLEWFLSNRGARVKGYSNAIFSGFPTVVLAEILKKVIIEDSELRGLYHISSDPISKLELLRTVNDAFGANVSIEPTEEFRIDRSLDSSRFRGATGFKPVSWDDMVSRMAEDAKDYDEWRR